MPPAPGDHLPGTCLVSDSVARLMVRNQYNSQGALAHSCSAGCIAWGTTVSHPLL